MSRRCIAHAARSTPGSGEGTWIDRPENPREITIWEHFDRARIIQNFFETMDNHDLAR